MPSKMERALSGEPPEMECRNCSAIWAPGSEEWETQCCSACGWRPGDPIHDDDDYWDPDDQDD